MVISCVVAIGGSGVASADAQPTVNESASIVELYPNPVPTGDPGEYILLQVDQPTNVTGWQITDPSGRTATLPNTTITDTVAFSTAPAKAGCYTDQQVLTVRGAFQLPNSGTTVTLRTANGGQIDAVTYQTAPEGERYQFRNDQWEWVPRGATDRAPVSARNVSTTAFVLPDETDLVEQKLHTADQRLLIGGYTLSSQAVVTAAIDAHNRGVSVMVLLDGAPIGGMSRQQVTALDRLTAAGVPVKVLAGEYTRYRTHHPKYAVIDDQALVLTENWKPAGTGGHSSRGWGVVLDDQTIADELAAMFWADANWTAAQQWDSYRSTVKPVTAQRANKTYPTRFVTEQYTATEVTITAAPENTGDALLERLENANESIHIQQVRIAPDVELLNATIAAARRGVNVEILLSSAWYVESENRELAARLRETATEEDLPITVALVEPRSRFEKVHAKGVIIDKQYVAVGSLNWNPTAVNDNREITAIINDSAVATHYLAVFRADDRGGRWLLPLSVAGGVLISWIGTAVILARRLSWNVTDR